MTVRLIITALVLLTVVACSTGPKRWEGANWKFHKIVDASFVKKMVSVPMDKDKMIVDSRPLRTKYIKGHIPGAISIPYSKFDKMTNKLPEDKDTQIVFYCGGLKCPLSHKSAWKAEDLGHTNVSVFAKGFPNWMKQKGNYSTISVEWLKKQVDKKKVVVIDSRPKRKKYDKGHIIRAISIPNSQFKKLKNRLPRNKKKTIVFYCGGFKCPLSHNSAKKAIKLGYKKVRVFAAGFPAWKKYTKMKTPLKITEGEEEGSIDHKLFIKIMKEDPSQIYLVDVRGADQYQKATIKTAVNIPVEDLESKISQLSTNKTIVFICNTGAQSGEAFYMLKDLKPSLKKVYYLDGTIDFKKDGSFTISKPE